MPEKKPTLELRRCTPIGPKGNQWFFVILALNGQELSFSKTYSRRSTSKRACDRLKSVLKIKAPIIDATDEVKEYPKLHL